MSAPRLSPFSGIYQKWKTLRLPWRRKFLVGTDLQGNTFWEFRDKSNSPLASTAHHRLRRIVQYTAPTHYSDVTITPQWHQWLRHTRIAAPTIDEQRADVARQRDLKQLARLADERWASKPSFLDRPKEQPAPATAVRDRGGYAAPDGPPKVEGVVDDRVTSPIRGVDGEGGLEPMEKGEKRERVQDKERGKNPWDVSRRGPNEGWQPEAWDPNRMRPRARN